jgi:alginate O-acetyltransferase complex protein AlgI
MLFNTIQYFAFLAAVIALFYLGPPSWRRVILLAASYFFYMWWNPVFILLVLALTAIDYGSAIWMDRVIEPARRQWLLIASLSANLGFLGYFKYYNFFASTIAQLLGRPADAFALSIVLPIGISFHTFQSMSYVVDVYRREQAVIRNPVDYALFIAFFPQLVAGPIVRARDFFRDLYHWQAPTALQARQAVFQVIFGLAKKMVLADQFALLADGYFQNVAAYPGAVPAWCGAVAFALQIYFDFSGYTDIAIGSAALLGFRFPVNFRRPYLAGSVTEFWRRWHISLSSWLRDYLYIPLGGNRHGTWLTYRNLMLTMLLGGVWHGASWNFAIWGAYHGALLSLERAMPVSRLWRPLGVLLTFVLVCVGWVFFRASTFADSTFVIGQMFGNPHGIQTWKNWHWFLAAVSFALGLLEENTGWLDSVSEAPAWIYSGAIALLLLGIELFGVTERSIPFVYFQF